MRAGWRLAQRQETVVSDIQRGQPTLAPNVADSPLRLQAEPGGAAAFEARGRSVCCTSLRRGRNPDNFT
jgi:hypothetical protein